MINPQLKLMVDKLSDLIDTILEKGGADISEIRGKALKIDLARYMMYLSASDGKIEWSEANNISQYLEMNLPPEAVNQLIRNNNIYSTDFEQEVPGSCKAIVSADNALWDNGDRETCGADLLLTVYKAVGEELIKADNDVDDNEKQDYTIYINTLENYINGNDKFKMGGGVYTGLKKNSSGSRVDAPMKSGVSAPRKR